MALSEHEQRLLDEMERSLYDTEADQVDVEQVRRPRSVRRIVLGMLLGVAGLGVLIAAVSLKSVLLGVIAFLMMVAGILFALSSSHGSGAHRDGPSDDGPHGGGGGGSARPSGRPRMPSGTGARRSALEDRWRRRMGDDDL